MREMIYNPHDPDIAHIPSTITDFNNTAHELTEDKLELIQIQ